MRTAYHQEKRKVVDLKKSGSGANDVHKHFISKVFWFEVFDTFLHSIVETRKTHFNSIFKISLQSISQIISTPFFVESI